MEDPLAEINGVVEGLVRAKDADAQRDVLQRYFLQGASFDHPMCCVTRTRNSRDAGLLQVYQFLRSVFMDTEIEIHSVAINEEKDRMYVEATQHLRSYIPFVRKYIYDRYARLLVVLSLQKMEDGKYYVSRQQDLYSIQEEAETLLPGGVDDYVVEIKAFVGYLLMLYVAFFQLFGIWRPRKPCP